MSSEVLVRDQPAGDPPAHQPQEPDRNAPPGQEGRGEDGGMRWLTPSLFRATAAWTGSMVVHAVGLILLAITMLPVALRPVPPELEALLDRPEQLTQLLDESLLPAPEVAFNVAGSTLLASGHSSPISGTSEMVFDRQVSESREAVKVKLGDVAVWNVKGSDLVMDVPDLLPGDPQAVVDGYDQAFDRITQEMVLMLLKDKVQVAWVFDQSESMKDDQQEIRDTHRAGVPGVGPGRGRQGRRPDDGGLQLRREVADAHPQAHQRRRGRSARRSTACRSMPRAWRCCARRWARRAWHSAARRQAAGGNWR